MVWGVWGCPPLLCRGGSTLSFSTSFPFSMFCRTNGIEWPLCRGCPASVAEPSPRCGWAGGRSGQRGALRLESGGACAMADVHPALVSSPHGPPAHAQISAHETVISLSTRRASQPPGPQPCPRLHTERGGQPAHVLMVVDSVTSWPWERPSQTSRPLSRAGGMKYAPGVEGVTRCHHAPPVSSPAQNRGLQQSAGRAGLAGEDPALQHRPWGAPPPPHLASWRLASDGWSVTKV